MEEMDIKCAEVFFREQLKLFPKPVAESVDEALEFLEDTLALVFDSKEELMEYLEEIGVDLDEEEPADMLEVFVIPDGRFLYVEA